MTDKPLKIVCDLMTEAHTRIQKDFENINPVVGVNQKMRDIGLATDVVTIDCLRTGKRIIIVLNDEQPDRVNYQFTFKAKDPADEFEYIAFDKLSVDVIYSWMKNYFSEEEKYKH